MDLFCIIIHVVGIDLHRKLLLMKESNLSMKYKQRNKQPSSFPPPEEIHIIDDNEITSRAPAKELHNSANSEKENGFL
jgi:ATP-dependent DNA helicase HFM1/MER3